MKNILKKLALLAIPVLLWLAFFIAFEPNNYFGLKASATSSQPVARVRAYQQEPGTNLILGDSRLAHFDMGLVDSLSGQSWQNLAFGGASLKETLDLADYLLDSGHDADTLLVEVSFYTLNAGYNTDRFATLEETLNNPLAYCFNLEYNVNALTVAMDTLRGTPDTIESGDWVEADYLADDGTVLPLHRKLYDYTATITPRCKSWALNDEQFNRLHTLARRCQSEGVRLVCIVVGPVYAVVAGGGHFMARCVQIHPFALALGGGQRRVKEAVSRGVYKIVGCTAVPAAIHVQPVADEVVPFVTFVRGGAALRGHKAVGAAAEQPQDVVGERNELARPHAAAVQVGFIVLQKDKLPVAAAVVFCTKTSVAALCQRL